MWFVGAILLNVVASNKSLSTNRIQTRVGSCDLVPQSTPGVLAYTIGTLDAWVQAANDPVSRLSACSSTLLHGTFSQGFAPTVGVHVGRGDNPGAAMVSTFVVHESYNGTDPNKCGMPLAVSCRGAGDILLDSWSFALPTRANKDSRLL